MSTPRLDNKEDALAGIMPSRKSWPKISAGAAGRDADPAFPEDPFRRLALAGVLAMPVPDPVGEHGRRASFTEEWRVLRAVARADGSVGRILDGHFNGVERLSLLAPEPLRSAELGGSRRRRTTPRGVGRGPHPGRGRPGPPRRVSEGTRSPASRRSVPDLRVWTARSCSRAETPLDRRCSPTSTSRVACRSTRTGSRARGCAPPRAIGSSSTGRRCSRFSGSRES